jgi:hypothetical protein
MHELSDSAKRFLDFLTLLFASVAAGMTLERVAAIITIAAGLMSIACGCVRLWEFRDRRRAARRA